MDTYGNVPDNPGAKQLTLLGNRTLGTALMALRLLPGDTPAKGGNAGDVGLLSQEDPLEEEWQPIPVFLPGKSHGQRSLAGCGPWGHKELDLTE